MPSQVALGLFLQQAVCRSIPGRCQVFAPLLFSCLGVQEPPPLPVSSGEEGASIHTQSGAGLALGAGSQTGAPP